MKNRKEEDIRDTKKNRQRKEIPQNRIGWQQRSKERCQAEAPQIKSSTPLEFLGLDRK